MTTETWEQRMSARGKERELAKESEEWVNDPHRDHHVHLRTLTELTKTPAGQPDIAATHQEQWCSCAAYLGEVRGVLHLGAPNSCDICGSTW